MEDQESVEEPINLDSVHESPEREHEDEETNCLLLPTNKGLHENCGHVDETSGKEYCKDAIPKAPPSKLEEVKKDKKE